jgi:hypothetical protein
VTHAPGRGWHAHVHLLASRKAWWEQADLAARWRRATDGHGTVVDIRDRDADVRAHLCRTLTYLFKPANVQAWGPAEIAQFSALGRTKFAECYGALRGLASDTADHDEDDTPPPRELTWHQLTAGAPCPSCGSPLTAQWWAAEGVRQARRDATGHSLAPPRRPRAA